MQFVVGQSVDTIAFVDSIRKEFHPAVTGLTVVRIEGDRLTVADAAGREVLNAPSRFFVPSPDRPSFVIPAWAIDFARDAEYYRGWIAEAMTNAQMQAAA